MPRRAGRKPKAPQRHLAMRLEEVRRAHGLTSLKDFWLALGGEDGAGCKYEAVRNYHFDRDAPTAYLARVCAVFPDVNPEWLLTGDGTPQRAEQATDSSFEELWTRTAAEWIPGYKSFPREAHQALEAATTGLISSMADGWEFVRRGADDPTRYEWNAVGVLLWHVHTECDRRTPAEVDLPTQSQWTRRYLLGASFYIHRLPAPGTGAPIADALLNLGYITPERWDGLRSEFVTDVPPGLFSKAFVERDKRSSRPSEWEALYRRSAMEGIANEASQAP